MHLQRDLASSWEEIIGMLYRTSFRQLGMVVHIFNPSTYGQRQGDLCEFKVSLVYKVGSRTAWDIQGSPVVKTKGKEKQPLVGSVC